MEDDKPKMMPGQEPYIPEDWNVVKKMIGDAAKATELFTEDELEKYAARQNHKA